MEQTNFNENVQRLCKVCGLANKIREKRKTCLKCVAKKNNARLNASNYYKNYYEQNKEAILKQQLEHYHTVTKLKNKN